VSDGNAETDSIEELEHLYWMQEVTIHKPADMYTRTF